jgi:hypothetical protein
LFFGLSKPSVLREALERRALAKNKVFLASCVLSFQKTNQKTVFFVWKERNYEIVLSQPKVVKNVERKGCGTGTLPSSIKTSGFLLKGRRVNPTLGIKSKSWYLLYGR